jgi:hypothetical protein
MKTLVDKSMLAILQIIFCPRYRQLDCSHKLHAPEFLGNYNSLKHRPLKSVRVIRDLCLGRQAHGLLGLSGRGSRLAIISTSGALLPESLNCALSIPRKSKTGSNLAASFNLV